jgi:Type II secretion system (T2SS), protein E, N-terminal domain
MQQFSQEPAFDLDPRSVEFADRFSEFLLAEKFLDELAVRRAQRAQRQSGERFDLVLMRLGLLSDAVMARALANFCKLPLVAEGQFPEEALLPEQISMSFLKLNRLVPLADKGDHILVAVADPFSLEAIDALSYLRPKATSRQRSVGCTTVAPKNRKKTLLLRLQVPKPRAKTTSSGSRIWPAKRRSFAWCRN